MKGVSARTRRAVLSRETIGRVIGGRPIWRHRAGLGRLAGRHYAVCSVRRRSRRVQPAAVMVLREDPATGEARIQAGPRGSNDRSASSFGESVLPDYVIHQLVILAVGFFVMQWPVDILRKWIVVFGVPLVVTLALVELRLQGRYTRVLLGARARPPAPEVPAPERAGVSGRPSLPTAGAHDG